MTFESDKAIATIILCSCLLSNEFEDPSTIYIIHASTEPSMSKLDYDQAPTIVIPWTIDMHLLEKLFKLKKITQKQNIKSHFSCKDLDFESRLLFAWGTTALSLSKYNLTRGHEISHGVANICNQELTMKDSLSLCLQKDGWRWSRSALTFATSARTPWADILRYYCPDHMFV